MQTVMHSEISQALYSPFFVKTVEYWLGYRVYEFRNLHHNYKSTLTTPIYWLDSLLRCYMFLLGFFVEYSICFDLLWVNTGVHHTVSQILHSTLVLLCHNHLSLWTSLRYTWNAIMNISLHAVASALKIFHIPSIASSAIELNKQQSLFTHFIGIFCDKYDFNVHNIVLHN